MFMDMLSQYNFYFLVIKIFLNCPFNLHSNLWYLWQFLICKQELNQQSHCQVTTYHQFAKALSTAACD